MNKYNYVKVIQQFFNGAYGWEDVSEYECNSTGQTKEMSGVFKELKNGRKRELTSLEHDLKEYQLTGYPTRVIFRRELIKKEQAV